MYQYQREENIDAIAIAMAYVPWQYMNQVFEDLGDALQIGTIFPELEKPFLRGCCSEIYR